MMNEMTKSPYFAFCLKVKLLANQLQPLIWMVIQFKISLATIVNVAVSYYVEGIANFLVEDVDFQLS